MGKEIFRKVSLERLSSPEQLDQLMKVTTPAGWASLLAIGGVMSAILIWSCTGSIPTKIPGAGILLRTGGVFDVKASGSGDVKAIYFAAGDTVKKGQIIARIAQPQLLEKVKLAKAERADLVKQKDQIARQDAEEAALELKSIAQQRSHLESSISAAMSDAEWLEERIKSQAKLLQDGLITRQQLLESEQQLEAVKAGIRASRNEFRLLDIKQVQLKSREERDLANIQNRVNESDRKIDLLLADLEKKSKVISPYNGHILRINADNGSLVSEGQTLCEMELMGDDIKKLTAVVYFPAGPGKKIRPGMLANISPSTIEQSEYGFLLGLVTHVAAYPSTDQSMLKTLKNERLVKLLSEGGAPIMAEVDLIPAPRNPSGYKWSSSEGPKTTLQTGTLCAGNVTVAKQKPISLIVPTLKKKILGVGDSR